MMNVQKFIQAFMRERERRENSKGLFIWKKNKKKRKEKFERRKVSK